MPQVVLWGVPDDLAGFTEPPAAWWGSQSPFPFSLATGGNPGGATVFDELCGAFTSPTPHKHS